MLPQERTPSPGPQQAWVISEGNADASNSQSTAKGTGLGAAPSDDQSCPASNQSSGMDSSRTELISPGDLDELLLSGDETSQELKQAAADAATMAADYRRRGETIAAEETQKIAESLERASIVSFSHPLLSDCCVTLCRCAPLPLYFSLLIGTVAQHAWMIDLCDAGQESPRDQIKRGRYFLHSRARHVVRTG